MLTAACLAIALAALGLCCWVAYAVGYTRKLREGEDFNAGKAEGRHLGLGEGKRERDALREELKELASTLDATMENFGGYVEDHANTYPPTIWSDAVPPGGQVCAVPRPELPGGICGYPVETVPCPEHTCRCLTALDRAHEDALALTVTGRGATS